ncbi:MAG: transposase [Deltaproteobacteria bacterium]|nr:transposase [Deltaproteobacteria bacterium]
MLHERIMRGSTYSKTRRIKSAFFAVTSKGNEEKDIFGSKKDREYFLHYLKIAAGRYDAAVHAYCLMSNHYQLLLEMPLGNLSQLMDHIKGAYTEYVNVKQKRGGSFFQGRYEAIVVEADKYVKEISRQIHLNPVTAGIVKKPEEFTWSSYNSYVGKELCPGWLTIDFILGYFDKKKSTAQEKYREFVELMIG